MMAGNGTLQTLSLYTKQPTSLTDVKCCEVLSTSGILGPNHFQFIQVLLWLRMQYAGNDLGVSQVYFVSPWPSRGKVIKDNGDVIYMHIRRRQQT